jgi:hypothetical protein
LDDAAFSKLMQEGIGRVYHRLDEDMPYVAPRLQAWMRDLAGSEEASDYFMHPAAFPLMRLPWWLEAQLGGGITLAFQRDLIASNGSMYYYIRLVDNIMDGHATVEPKLLPAAGYFVERFESAYHPYFERGHPFWELFARTWSEFCDVTAADGHLIDVDEKVFTELVGRKVCAAKISVAAVLYRHDRPDLVSAWSEWIDLFGCWHLFQEDMFDWQQDLNLGAKTYFLCEARRRKGPNELEVSWLAREGLEWGFGLLAAWMARLRRMEFVPQDVAAYLEMREKRLYAQRAKISSALDLIRKLSDPNLSDRSGHVPAGSN